MKHSFLAILSFIIILVGASALPGSDRKSGTAILGRVNPMDGATVVWAVTGKDSISSTIINGAFNFSVKPGIYKVFIDAVTPYKDAVLENISVKEGQSVDVGEILLQR